MGGIAFASPVTIPTASLITISTMINWQTLYVTILVHLRLFSSVSYYLIIKGSARFMGVRISQLIFN